MSITKILLSEAVSTGKRLALMEKILKVYNEWCYVGNPKKVMKFISDNPRVVERLIKDKTGNPSKITMTKHELTDISKYNSRTIFIASIVIKFFKVLEEADPTNNMKYGNWLVDTVLTYAFERGMFGNRLGSGRVDVLSNAQFILEERGAFFQDLPKMHAYLSAYDEAKRTNELPKEFRDITNLIDNFHKANPHARIYDPWYVLNHVTTEFRTKFEGDVFQNIKERLKEGEDYEFYGEADGFKIYHPLTQKGASILGTNTEWCTTYGEHCSNPDYQDRTSYFDGYGDLIILIDISNPEIKYQFSFDSSEYMDQDDVPVDMKDFFNQNPKASEQIVKYSKAEDTNWIKEVIRFADLKKHPWIGEYILNSLVRPKIDSSSTIGLYSDSYGWFVGVEDLQKEIYEVAPQHVRERWNTKHARSILVAAYLDQVWDAEPSDLIKVDHSNYEYMIRISVEKAVEWVIYYNSDEGDVPEFFKSLRL